MFIEIVLCSKNKSTDQQQLICAFVLMHEKSRFSHDEAHLIVSFDFLSFM